MSADLTLVGLTIAWLSAQLDRTFQLEHALREEVTRFTGTAVAQLDSQILLSDWNPLNTTKDKGLGQVASSVLPADTAPYQCALIQSGILATSMAADGDWLVAGTPSFSQAGVRCGAAFVYERRHVDGAAVWTLHTVLTPDSCSDGDRFGASVAIALPYLAVGSTRPKPSKHDNAGGNVSIFNLESLRGVPEWRRAATLVSPDSEPKDLFGHSLAMCGQTLAVGAPGATAQGNKMAGKAFVFRVAEDTEQWSNIGIVAREHCSEVELFGHSVAIDDEWLAIGCPLAWNPTALGPRQRYGCVSCYRIENGKPQLVQTVQDPTNDPKGEFGHKVAMRNGYLLVGAPGATVDASSVQGKVLVHRAALREGALKWEYFQTLHGQADGGWCLFGISFCFNGTTLCVAEQSGAEDRKPSVQLYIYTVK